MNNASNSRASTSPKPLQVQNSANHVTNSSNTSNENNSEKMIQMQQMQLRNQAE
jgi:hypothetical protein